MAGKTDKDAKEALARVAKLIKAVPEGQRKLRHDAGSADLTPRPGRSQMQGLQTWLFSAGPRDVS